MALGCTLDEKFIRGSVIPRTLTSLTRRWSHGRVVIEPLRFVYGDCVFLMSSLFLRIPLCLRIPMYMHGVSLTTLGTRLLEAILKVMRV